MESIRAELYKNRDNIPNTIKAVSPLLNSCFSKGDMLKEIERIEGRELNVDFAIPQSLFDQLHDLGIDPSPYVYDYTEKSHGEPMNLHQRYIQALWEEFNR